MAHCFAYFVMQGGQTVPQKFNLVNDTCLFFFTKGTYKMLLASLVVGFQSYKKLLSFISSKTRHNFVNNGC